MRRTRHILLSIVMLIFILNCLTVDGYAAGSGWITKSLSEDDKQRIISNLSIQPITTPGVHFAIDRFAVSDSGMVALVFEHTIEIYDSSGVFQYGYYVDTYGSIAAGWFEDNIVIYYVRSDLAVEVDREGNCISIAKIAQTITDRNERKWDKVLHSTSHTAGGCVYRLDRDLASDMTYSRLLMTDPAGQTHVLYDLSALHNVRTVVMWAFYLSIIIPAVITLRRVIARRRERRAAETTHDSFNQDSSFDRSLKHQHLRRRD